MFIFIKVLSRRVTKRGCDISPTQRSVTAKFPNSSFVDECREVTLGRAFRINALPREAVIARKMFKADRNTSTSGCIGINWVSVVVMFTSSELVIVFEFNSWRRKRVIFV